jgi:putative SOS response-associated peptidase YedK
MCSNYTPARSEQIKKYFGVEPPAFDFKPETYPGTLAPVIRLPQYEKPADVLEDDEVECIPGCFGLVPAWADLKLARSTYNARSETVATKPSFRHAWKKRQFCVIPLASFFEPNYETGKAVRWRIAHSDGQPLGVAGIWEWRPNGGPDDRPLVSFSMLTINADKHPLMRRFHKPGDEKRMLVILEPDQYQPWMHSSLDGASSFLMPFPAEQLVAEAAPKPTAKKTGTASLFDA